MLASPVALVRGSDPVPAQGWSCHESASDTQQDAGTCLLHAHGAVGHGAPPHGTHGLVFPLGTRSRPPTPLANQQPGSVATHRGKSETGKVTFGWK